MEGSLRLELSYHSLTGYCVTATLTTHIGVLGESRTVTRTPKVRVLPLHYIRIIDKIFINFL